MDDRFHSLPLAPLFLRIGLGILAVANGWSRISNLDAVVSLWQTMHLPGPAVLGSGLEIAEFCGGILLIVGLLTRALGLFFALVMLGEILATKAPLANLGGWALEWQSLWMALALLVLGAGSVSLDGLLRRRAQHLLHPS